MTVTRRLARFAVCLLALTVAVSARGATAEASFAPDGSAILATWRATSQGAAGMAIVDVRSGHIELLEQGAPVLGAAWSPDSQRVIYATGGSRPQARILDRRSGRVRTLPIAIQPPYCWREDGARVAGVYRSDEGVLHLVVFNTKEFGLAHRVPVEVDELVPRTVVWLENTDDVAFVGLRGGRADVYSVEGGEFKQISTSGDVIALAHGDAATKLVWARRSKNPGYILLSLYEYDTEQRNVRRLPFPERVVAINPAPTRAPLRLADVVLEPRLGCMAVVAEYADAKVGRTTLKLFVVALTGSVATLVRTAVRTGNATYPVLTPFFCIQTKQLGVLHQDVASQRLVAFRADGSEGRVIAAANLPQ